MKHTGDGPQISDEILMTLADIADAQAYRDALTQTGRHIDKVSTDLAIDLRDNGVALGDIARALQLNPKRLSTKIERRRRTRSASNSKEWSPTSRDDTLVRAYETGMTTHQLAAAFDLDEPDVRAILLRRGVSLSQEDTQENSGD